MVKQRNEFSEVILKLLDEFRDLHERAQKSEAIPFGQETVRRDEARRRMPQMTAEQRRQLIQQPDQRERILDMLRNGEL